MISYQVNFQVRRKSRVVISGHEVKHFWTFVEVGDDLRKLFRRQFLLELVAPEVARVYLKISMNFENILFPNDLEKILKYKRAHLSIFWQIW
jgi:hypothetical protein